MEQNIAALKKQLSTVGFEDGLEYPLRSRMCFLSPQFTIQQKVVKGGDVLHFGFHFEWIGEEIGYCCRYYDAVLRKEIEIPDTILSEINIHELDKQMGLIDWSIGFASEHDYGANGGDATWKREKAISGVVAALAMLNTQEEGKEIADRLKMKYWADQPPEQYISGLASLKSRFEISQRFYFFSAAECITIEEAYRFLNNKWMEKKVRKKTNEQDVLTGGQDRNDPSKKGGVKRSKR
jgi:hypothetical protein